MSPRKRAVIAGVGTAGAWSGFALVAAILVLSASRAGDETEDGVNKDEYDFFAAALVRDIYDLGAAFGNHQRDFLAMAPPYTDLVMTQPGLAEVVPFDPKGFPEDFVTGLEGVDEYSVTATLCASSRTPRPGPCSSSAPPTS